MLDINRVFWDVSVCVYVNAYCVFIRSVCVCVLEIETKAFKVELLNK